MPKPPLTPPDTKFNPQASANVQAWHTGSGHVLVQTKINGKEAGYMMLDTGAPIHLFIPMLSCWG